MHAVAQAPSVGASTRDIRILHPDGDCKVRLDEHDESLVSWRGIRVDCVVSFRIRIAILLDPERI